MIPERVQAIVDCISKECNRRFHGSVSLIWFGSWIKGTAHQCSDIDLAIEPRGKLNPKDLVAFRNWLDEFPTLYRIDLVEMKQASDRLKREIEQYGKMMSDKHKLVEFTKSVENLKSILFESKTPIVRDAAIKRYELCYELAWKSVQERLRGEGLEVCKSPKTCFKQAFEQGWIEDEETFIEMIQNRNLTTHTYNEDLAEEIYTNLRKYLSLFLLTKLQTQ